MTDIKPDDIEAVARAICVAEGCDPEWECAEPISGRVQRQRWQEYVDAARAAILAYTTRHQPDHIKTRISDIEQWLSENAPYASVEQRHLVEGSPERAYWHFGYMMALRDVLALLPRHPPDNRPIPMVLYCPACSAQHIDAPQPEKDWTNPPHRSHECQSCGFVWRPADVPTTGVAAIETRGKADMELPAKPAPDNRLAELQTALRDLHQALLANTGAEPSVSVRDRAADALWDLLNALRDAPTIAPQPVIDERAVTIKALEAARDALFKQFEVDRETARRTGEAMHCGVANGMAAACHILLALIDRAKDGGAVG